MDLYIDVKKLLVGGWVVVVVHLDYNVSSGPFLSFDIGDLDRRWTFALYIDVKKFTGGWLGCGG